MGAAPKESDIVRVFRRISLPHHGRISASESLRLPIACPIEALNGGLFLSTGKGGHPVRLLDSHELIFVQRGRLRVFEEQKQFTLGPEQTLLLRPGHLHGGLAPYGPDLSYFWVHFKVRESPGRRPAGELFELPQCTTISDPERLTELFRLFLSYQESGRRNEAAGAYLLMVMLSEVYQAGRGLAEQDSADALLACRIDTTIAEFAHERISTSVVAAKLNYNPDYIERVYRRHSGISITDAIHRRRIKEARAELLMRDDKNIDEIGFDCGYPNPKYFRRMFKRLTHTTPKEYRQLFSRVHINTH